ncbi:MAG TPA: hypothetical protein DCW68_06925 [Rhodospirillaceae bacterium]|nr:hypothetical protein [Rhodospirillaceae bacterium]
MSEQQKPFEPLFNPGAGPAPVFPDLSVISLPAARDAVAIRWFAMQVAAKFCAPETVPDDLPPASPCHMLQLANHIAGFLMTGEYDFYPDEVK